MPRSDVISTLQVSRGFDVADDEIVRRLAPGDSPKNLAMALSVEAAELLEHFQWLSESESANVGEQTRDEVAAEIAAPWPVAAPTRPSAFLPIGI